MLSTLSAEQANNAMSGEPVLFSAESYFATQLPPPSLEEDIAFVKEFVHRQAESGRRVVLVTVSYALSARL